MLKDLRALLKQIDALETWTVDDPLSPFIAETVVSREDVVACLKRFWKTGV